MELKYEFNLMYCLVFVQVSMVEFILLKGNFSTKTKVSPLENGIPFHTEPFSVCRDRVSGRRGRKLTKTMDELADTLRAGLPAVCQSQKYQTRRGTIDEEFQKAQVEAFATSRNRLPGVVSFY
ncbi:AAA family ATPase [Rhizobiales bacterium]|uniref:AAA family ATPase n=1 Tax=Hongsoonwoonella zoysiae TaxID=2821844 RepID=UPI001560D416|nr:AAA family ATPase [Hongsoonwoonella zoysiae]NRG18730.1 AAA family ATPase [Hongsoonwoonella zoysiae]